MTMVDIDDVFDLDFRLPAELEASEPPEARGLERDEVRLLITSQDGERIAHRTFHDLPDILEPGDLLVINTSGTLNASLNAHDRFRGQVELHLSTQLPGNLWTVEVRGRDGGSTFPIFEHLPGTDLDLPGDGRAHLLGPYDCGCGRASQGPGSRLWLASLHLPLPLVDYLARFGHPIRYDYVKEPWPAEYYQTVYATESGSAEMPSAGRSFTPRLITRLIASGIQIAPLVLHTGVASPEAHEPPYEERYRVPLATARLVNAAHNEGRRVIAVGTTVVRALETVTDETGSVHPGEGWTCTVVTPESGIRSVASLLTGLHEPRSSHLMMLQALAGRRHLSLAYAAALGERYLWHEFGDMHLILP